MAILRSYVSSQRIAIDPSTHEHQWQFVEQDAAGMGRKNSNFDIIFVQPH